MRLSQVMIFTHDVARLEAFYTGVFGMAVVDGSAADGFVRIGRDGCVLALHAIRGPWASSEPEDRTAFPTKLCFHTDDLAATRDRLVGLGLKWGPVHTFAEVSFSDGADPDGNVLQLTTRP